MLDLPLGTCQTPPLLMVNSASPTLTSTFPIWTKKTICILRAFFALLNPPGGKSTMPHPKNGNDKNLAYLKSLPTTSFVSIELDENAKSCSLSSPSTAVSRASSQARTNPLITPPSASHFSISSLSSTSLSSLTLACVAARRRLGPTLRALFGRTGAGTSTLFARTTPTIEPSRLRFAFSPSQYSNGGITWRPERVRRVDEPSAGDPSRRIVRLRPEGRLEGLWDRVAEVWAAFGGCDGGMKFGMLG